MLIVSGADTCRSVDGQRAETYNNKNNDNDDDDDDDFISLALFHLNMLSCAEQCK